MPHVHHKLLQHHPINTAATPCRSQPEPTPAHQHQCHTLRITSRCNTYTRQHQIHTVQRTSCSNFIPSAPLPNKADVWLPQPPDAPRRRAETNHHCNARSGRQGALAAAIEVLKNVFHLAVRRARPPTQPLAGDSPEAACGWWDATVPNQTFGR